MFQTELSTLVLEILEFPHSTVYDGRKPPCKSSSIQYWLVTDMTYMWTQTCRRTQGDSYRPNTALARRRAAKKLIHNNSSDESQSNQ